MATARHGYPHGVGGIAPPLEITVSPDYFEPAWHGNGWIPVAYDPSGNPLRHGIETFFQRKLPDGTPLTPEERKYIAGIVVSQLKELEGV